MQEHGPPEPSALWMLFSTAGMPLSSTVTRRPRYLKLSTFSSGTPLMVNTVSCATRFSSSKCLFCFRSAPSWHLLVPGCVECRTKSGTNMSHLPHRGSDTCPSSVMCMMSRGWRRAKCVLSPTLGTSRTPLRKPRQQYTHTLVSCSYHDAVHGLSGDACKIERGISRDENDGRTYSHHILELVLLPIGFHQSDNNFVFCLPHRISTERPRGWTSYFVAVAFVLSAGLPPAPVLGSD
jgi:hypothetical protein